MRGGSLCSLRLLLALFSLASAHCLCAATARRPSLRRVAAAPLATSAADEQVEAEAEADRLVDAADRLLSETVDALLGDTIVLPPDGITVQPGVMLPPDGFEWATAAGQSAVELTQEVIADKVVAFEEELACSSAERALAQDLAASEGSTTVLDTVLNIFNNVAGAGVLTLAYGMRGVGWVPAFASVVCIGAISGYTFYLVGAACESVGANSFKDLWGTTLGEGTAWVVGEGPSVHTCPLCCPPPPPSRAMPSSAALPSPPSRPPPAPTHHPLPPPRLPLPHPPPARPTQTAQSCSCASCRRSSTRPSSATSSPPVLLL